MFINRLVSYYKLNILYVKHVTILPLYRQCPSCLESGGGGGGWGQGEGWYLTNFSTGILRPEDQTFSLLYTTFDQKDTPYYLIHVQ